MCKYETENGLRMGHFRLELFNTLIYSKSVFSFWDISQSVLRN